LLWRRIRHVGVIGRRAVLFGAPLLAYVAGMLHPTHVLVGGSPWLYIGVHLAWALIACLLAWMLILLVDGVEGLAARTVRVLAIPFAVSYTLFTSFGGVAIGAFVWKANELPPDQRPAAATLIDIVTHSSLAGPIRVCANLLWLAAALAVVLALRKKAPLPALALLAVGAAIFAYRHERPWGAGGMAALLAGVVWLELKPAPAPEPRLTQTLRVGR
jgi:hypothetical protein